MFGQRPAFGGTSFGTFGSNTSTGFGSSAFGRPAFGAPTTTASTPFGTNTSTGTSLFGQSATGTTGLFGSSTQPAATGFGAAATGTGFGTTPQAGTTSFGAGGGFGAPTGGLFGSTQPQQTGGLFGSTTSTGFNASQTQARPFSFGTPTTSASGGLFGSTTTGAGLFGSTTMATQTQGTTIKYVPVTGTDTISRAGTTSNIQTRIEVITAMKEYESKSFEELRVEDYMAGRKGPTGTASTGFGFGQQQNKGFLGSAQPATGGLFGSTSTAGSLFGQKPPENKSLFGSTPTSGFGTPSTSSGLFGTTPFGQATTSASTGFTFGQNANKSTGFTFGQTTSAPSLFGQTTQPQNTFGSTSGGGFSFGNQQNTQAGGGLFGQQAKPTFGNAGSSLFGNKPATTGFTGFGATPAASPFGTATSTPATGGLFGNQNKSGFSLGTGTSVFGQTNTGFGTGLFGQNTAAKPGGLFGQTQTSGFGTNTSSGGFSFNTPASGTGLFGNTGGGIFSTGGQGLGTNQFGGGLNTNTGFGIGNMQANNMGGTNPLISNDNINNLIKALTHTPFGNSTLLKSGSVPTGKADELLNSAPGGVSSNGDQPKPSATRKPTYVLPSGSTNSPKPIGLNRLSSHGIMDGTADSSKNILFAGLEENNESSVNSNVEDPFKQKSFPSVRKLNLKVFNNTKNGNLPNPINDSNSLISSNTQNQSPLTTPLTTPITSPGFTQPLQLNESLNEVAPTPDIIKGRNNMKNLNIIQKNSINDTIADLNVGPKGSSSDEYKALPSDLNISLFDTSCHDDGAHLPNTASSNNHPAGLQQTRPGYYTLPSLDDLGEMVDSNDSCLVENFTVGRSGYGNICFLGITDVSGLNIDDLIHIVRKEVDVYPEGFDKPLVGEGLNKSALVTLDCVWPVDKTSREVIKCEERLNAMGWAQYLERKCFKMDASYIEYRPETGSWVFKVKHFSKYGLQDEDDDTPVAGAVVPPTPRMPLQISSEAIMNKPLQLAAETPILSHKNEPVNLFVPMRSETDFVSREMESSGPPALGLSAPPQTVQMGYVDTATTRESNIAQTMRKFFLDGSQNEYLQESVLENVAVEPVESASMCPLSPSAERLTLSSKASGREIQSMKSHLFYNDDDEFDQDFDFGRSKLTQVGEREPSFEFSKYSSKRLLLSSSQQHQHPSIIEKICSTSVQRLNPLVELIPVIDRREFVEPQRKIIQKPLRDPRSDYYSLASDKSLAESQRIQTHHLSEKLELSESLIKIGNQKCSADAAVLMGRSFRVGWGPRWTLAHIGECFGKSLDEDMEEDAEEDVEANEPMPFLFLGAPNPSIQRSMPKKGQRRCVTIEKLDLMEDKKSVVKPFMDTLLEGCLRNVLECSTAPQTNSKCETSLFDGPSRNDFNTTSIESSANSCPYLKANSGIDLLHRLAITTTQLEDEEGRKRRMSSIFDLCAALWGQLEFYSSDADGSSIYNESQARKEALSRWIEEESETKINEEVAQNEVEYVNNSETYIQNMFLHLTGRQVEEACTLAQEKGDHHLALLLSQSCLGDSTPRYIIQQQLNSWTESGLDTYISEQRLILYTILAGLPTYQSSKRNINSCLGLDWKRALGLHLWYFTPGTGTIAEALESYEKAAGLIECEESLYCEKPLPDYWDEYASQENLKDTYNIGFHLLKLYVDSTHNLKSLLETATITADPLNLTISWLLWCILESLGYSFLTPSKVCYLHKSMAAQLEAQGHWQWATFVLLHIAEDCHRYDEVVSLLSRNILVDGEDNEDTFYKEKEHFILLELKLSANLLYRAKAIRAKSLKLMDEEAYYRIKSSDYTEAHKIIIDTIAPNSIVNEDHEFLLSYLNDFLPSDVQSMVSDWSVGGAIYYDYIQIVKQVDEMKKSGEPTGAKIEAMRPRLLALCTRLNNLKASTAVHSLAISEMSRMVISVLRAFLGDDPNAVRVLALQVAQLPLTHECALQELNMITHQYLTQVVGLKD